MFSKHMLVWMIVIISLIGGMPMHAQSTAPTTSSAQTTIIASVPERIKINVIDGATQSWTLDRRATYFQTTIANAIEVSCTKNTWTLSASANPDRLTSEHIPLNNKFYIEALPTSGTGSNLTSSVTAKVLWKNGGRGIKKTTIRFTQPMSPWDRKVTGYGTVVTFTAAIT